MTDRRELVLQRVTEIMQTIPYVQAVVRNRGELPADKRPALAVLDADETARVTHDQSRGRLVASPAIVDMTPEIYVVMDSREPPNENIGQDMNALRIMIVKALYADAPLGALLGSNGGVKYAGCSTDMAVGRSMEGQMSIRVTFTYPLLPNEL